jgi:predicted deacetylase
VKWRLPHGSAAGQILESTSINNLLAPFQVGTAKSTLRQAPNLKLEIRSRGAQWERSFAGSRWLVSLDAVALITTLNVRVAESIGQSLTPQKAMLEAS